MSRLAILLFAALFASAIAKHHVVEAEEESAALEENENQHDLEEEDEDEDEEINTKIASVISDVKAMQKDVLALHKPAISDNLKAILADAKELKTAKGDRAHNLKLAIQDRAKALDIQMKLAKKPELEEEEEEEEDADENKDAEVEAEAENDNENEEKNVALEEDEDEEEEEERKPVKASKSHQLEEERKLSAVEQDVKQILSEVKKSSAPKAEKKETIDNLNKILADARRYSATHDANIKKAIHLRLEALEEQLGEKEEVKSKKPAESKLDNKASRVAAVVKDVQDVRAHLSEHKLSKKAKHEVLSNLESIEKDAKLLSKASGSNAKRLSKAINLRMQALEEQLA